MFCGLCGFLSNLCRRGEKNRNLHGLEEIERAESVQTNEHHTCFQTNTHNAERAEFYPKRESHINVQATVTHESSTPCDFAIEHGNIHAKMGGLFSLRFGNSEQVGSSTPDDLKKYLTGASKTEAQEKTCLKFVGNGKALEPVDIPNDIGQFVHLTSLTISNLKIQKIPWSFIYLQNVKNLDLSSNVITELPKYIFQLKRLERLNLDNNQLIGLPRGILYLRSLKWISVKGNTTIVSPPYEVCLGGLTKILSYLTSRTIPRNAWADSLAFYDPRDNDWYVEDPESNVKSLFSLAVHVVIESGEDYLSPVYVAPRLKTYLQKIDEDKEKKSIQVAKCTDCKKFFSNVYYFERHSCEQRVS